MNFKNNELLLLVVAFILGYFFKEIMKGCNLVEGIAAKSRCEASGIDGYYLHTQQDGIQSVTSISCK